MAISTIKVTVGQALPGGGYNSTSGAGTPPAALDTLITAAIAAAAAVTANATVSLDPTALALAQASDAAIAAVATGRTTLEAGDVVILINNAVVTSRNQLKAAFREAERLMLGSSALT